MYEIAQAINKSNIKNTDVILLEDIKKVFGIILHIVIFKLQNRHMY